MSKKNTATTTATMTAAEFKQKSYDAYLAYVEFIEGKKSIIETVEALSPLMSAYGFALSVDNLANLLTVKMTAYGKDKGEQAKKVKSISTFRAFVKGGWKDVQNAPVHSNAGKNPADAKAKSTNQEAHESRIGSRNRRSARQAGSRCHRRSHRRKGGVTLPICRVSTCPRRLCLCDGAAFFALKPPDESLKITTKRPSWASRYPNAFMKGVIL